MKSISFKIFLLCLLIIGLYNITPSFCFAQDQIGVEESDINVEVSPDNPEPYDDVTISITSYATDLNKAIVSWRIGSEIVLSGIGKTFYTFKAGGAGSASTINIEVTPVGGVGLITKTIHIYPSEVEMVWESEDGYVPPFYKGRTLPVKGGKIRVVAIPNTDTIKSGVGSITYTWSNNGGVVQDYSGYNKNSFIFKNNMLDYTNEVSVTASSVSDNYSATNDVQIPLFDPKIIFYKKSPTDGVLYDNALNKEIYMPEDEVTIVAEPYFMSVKNSVNDLDYVWKINDNNINTPSKKNELTVRPTSHGGYATMNLVVENLSELFQKVTSGLKINL